MVTEDTQAPTITYTITDEDSVPVLDNSIVRGEYTLRIETSELLNDFPPHQYHNICRRVSNRWR